MSTKLTITVEAGVQPGWVAIEIRGETGALVTIEEEWVGAWMRLREVIAAMAGFVPRVSGGSV